MSLKTLAMSFHFHSATSVVTSVDIQQNITAAINSFGQYLQGMYVQLA